MLLSPIIRGVGVEETSSLSCSITGDFKKVLVASGASPHEQATFSLKTHPLL